MDLQELIPSILLVTKWDNRKGEGGDRAGEPGGGSTGKESSQREKIWTGFKFNFLLYLIYTLVFYKKGLKCVNELQIILPFLLIDRLAIVT